MTKEELYAHPGWAWCTFEGGAKADPPHRPRNHISRKTRVAGRKAETLALSFRASRESARKNSETQNG